MCMKEETMIELHLWKVASKYLKNIDLATEYVKSLVVDGEINSSNVIDL